MEKKYKYILITVLVIVSMSATTYGLWYAADTISEKHLGEPLPSREIGSQSEQRHRIFAQWLTPVELTEEQAKEAETIVTSNNMAKAVVQIMGNPQSEMLPGYSPGTVVAQYRAEEWSAQIVVDLDEEKVVSIMLNRGPLPYVVNPVKLVQVAEKEFPRKEFGAPLLKKIRQTDKDSEVVFLTEKGTVTIKVDSEQGRVIELEKEKLSPLFWWMWPLLGVAAVAGVAVIIIIALVVRKRRKSTSVSESKSKSTEPSEAGPSSKSQE